MVIRSGTGGSRARSASGSPPAASHPPSASPSPPAASADETGYSRWLRNCPKPARTGSVVDDEANIVVRDTLMKLIHHLQQNPHEILMNWTRVSSQHDRDIAEQMNSESWDRSVHTVKRIPKPWKAQWLIQHDTCD